MSDPIGASTTAVEASAPQARSLFLNPQAPDADLDPDAAVSPVASLFGHWYTHFLEELRKHGEGNLLIKAVGGAAVTKAGLAQELALDPQVDIVFFMGHGLPCCLLGRVDHEFATSHLDHDHGPGTACAQCFLPGNCAHPARALAILDGENFHTMDGRLVIMFTCSAALDLGEKLKRLPSEGSGFFAFERPVLIYTEVRANNFLRQILTEVLKTLHDRTIAWRDRYARAGRVFQIGILRAAQRLQAIIGEGDDEEIWALSAWQDAFRAHPEDAQI